MNFRKIKRICDVRGCKNLDCFVIARSREVGNSVIICKDCLSEALEAVKGYMPEPKKESASAPPPLFFNAPAESVESVKNGEPAEETPNDVKETLTDGNDNKEQSVEPDAIEPERAEEQKFICPECGKEFKSAAGLQSHMRTHNKGDK